MQIAGFNVDKMSSRSKAAITWVGIYPLASKKEMKESGFWLPTITNDGGWKKSDMRYFLDDEVLSHIDERVAKHIVTVEKENQEGCTYDKIWLLSVDEYNRYSNNGNITFASKSFWLRDTSGKSKFYMVGKRGGLMTIFSNVKDGVLVGFCTN